MSILPVIREGEREGDSGRDINRKVEVISRLFPWTLNDPGEMPTSY
jgi:hypothetical protein